MEPIEVTRLSSKGQVVLPQAVRDRLGLEEGASFAVIGEGDVVILKKLEVPARKQLRELLKQARSYARKVGLKQSNVSKASKQIRAKQ